MRRRYTALRDAADPCAQDLRPPHTTSPISAFAQPEAMNPISDRWQRLQRTLLAGRAAPPRRIRRFRIRTDGEGGRTCRSAIWVRWTADNAGDTCAAPHLSTEYPANRAGQAATRRTAKQ